MTSVAAFGACLLSCRESAGLSQEELAGRAGLSIRAISNLERGRTTSPHRRSLERLADALALRGEARERFFAAAGRSLDGDGHAAAVEVAGGPGQPSSGQAGAPAAAGADPAVHRPRT